MTVKAWITKTSEWAQGWEGSLFIANDNDYDILNWRLDCTPGRFSWISDVDVLPTSLVPKEWTREIPAKATREIKFGGVGPEPANLKFVQLLPLTNPQQALAKRGKLGPKIFAPYVDACAYPTPKLASFAPQRFFTLAFITSQNGQPAWGGVIPLAKQHLVDQINDVRAAGGDVIVSFGGANGVELAQDIKDVPALADAYQRVIDMYSCRYIDFDVEGGAVADAPSVDRRNKAAALLQQRNKDLTVAYCLPVLPTGLTADGLNVLKNAVQNKVRVDVVTVMTMDFGDSAAPSPQGRMGDYCIAAAKSTRAQLLGIGLKGAKIGVCPMIGVNDVETEVFTLEDAKKVAAFAKATPWVRLTAFWSVNRDRDDGQRNANPASSGVAQSPLAFTRAFRG